MVRTVKGSGAEVVMAGMALRLGRSVKRGIGIQAADADAGEAGAETEAGADFLRASKAPALTTEPAAIARA
jgi:hypothetical protein